MMSTPPDLLDGTRREAHWLQLYDGGPLLADRVGRPDEFVSNWGASVVGGIQAAAKSCDWRGLRISGAWRTQ